MNSILKKKRCITLFSVLFFFSSLQLLFAQTPGAFVTQWRTTTANKSITIPTVWGGYNYNVNWGDGSTNTGQTGNTTHIYATPRVHTVSITGAFPRIFFNNTGDKDKIINIVQWGNIAWTSMGNAFQGCSNLTMTATDVPNLSNVANIEVMFGRATVFNGNISGWNVSSVTNMSNMFERATSFNQDIGDWNISNASDLDLDSDGDGCYDKYEASVPEATFSTGNYIDSVTVVPGTAGDVGANGLSNALESDDSFNATINYTLTYNLAADSNDLVCSTLFPVELVSFDVALDDKREAVLTWQTVSEFNNDYFEVYKSRDGVNWAYFTTVNGNGNSTTVINYKTIDSNPYLGNTYYRLKQVDFDEAFEYSKIRSVYFTENGEGEMTIRAYPNPASDICTIESNQSIDISKLKKQTILGLALPIIIASGNESNKLNVDVSGYQSGVYYINMAK